MRPDLPLTALLLLGACAPAGPARVAGTTAPHGQASSITARAPPRRPPEDVPLAFDRGLWHLEGTLSLPARAEGERVPAVVIVHGSGPMSRDGVMRGQIGLGFGFDLPVYRRLAARLTEHGYAVYRYDKRTCGPNNVATCVKNPQDDVDQAGPVALARDVDAACAVLKTQPGFDGRIVLFAHGQAGQVALSSTCAQEAAGVVLFSPIPRAVDLVLVDALRDRQARAEKAASATKDPAGKQILLQQATSLKGVAASKEASFASMRAGKFEKNARVEGATVAFWLGWIELTKKTNDLAGSVQDHLVIVSGKRDLQSSPKDRAAAKALPARAVVEVDADHHLLNDGALAPATVDAVGAALDALLQGTPRS